jgi:hypothetical protein
LKLPRLGRSKVMLYSRVDDSRRRAALRALAAKPRHDGQLAGNSRTGRLWDKFARDTDGSDTDGSLCP